MVVKKINSDSLFKASFSNIMDTNLIPYRKIIKSVPRLLAKD